MLSRCRLWAGLLDAVLMPALLVFVGITFYVPHRRRKTTVCDDQDSAGKLGWRA